MEDWVKEANRLHVEEKMPVTKIAKVVNKSHTTIVKYFKKYGLEYTNQNTKNDSLYDKAIEKYKNEDCSLTKLAEEFKIDRHILSKRIKQQDIDVVNKQNLIRFNENIFDSIDTEEKAYWLGFLYADGAVSSVKNRNVVEISLKYSDYEHLLKFKNFMNCLNEITVDEVRCRIMFSSSHFKEILISLGCTPQKSLTLEFPNKNQVSDELIIPFIRGYFDGDGTLSYSRHGDDKKILYPSTGFIGTKNVLENIQIKLNLFSKLYLANKNGSNKCFQFSLAKKDSITLLDTIYSNASIFLDRKYKRYTIFKENNFAVQDSNILDYEEAISEETKEYLNNSYNLNFDVNTEIINENKESLTS